MNPIEIKQQADRILCDDTLEPEDGFYYAKQVAQAYLQAIEVLEKIDNDLTWNNETQLLYAVEKVQTLLQDFLAGKVKE